MSYNCSLRSLNLSIVSYSESTKDLSIFPHVVADSVWKLLVRSDQVDVASFSMKPALNHVPPKVTSYYQICTSLGTYK